MDGNDYSNLTKEEAGERAETFSSRGASRFSNGDYNGAIEDFSEAIRLTPDNALTYNQRGLARKALGDYNGAIEDFTSVIELNPAFVRAYYNRGAVRCEKEDYSSGLEDFEKYLELGGGKRFGDQGRVAGWVADLKKALKEE